MFSRANGVRVLCLTIYEYSFLNIIYGTNFPYLDKILEVLALHPGDTQHDKLPVSE